MRVANRPILSNVLSFINLRTVAPAVMALTVLFMKFLHPVTFTLMVAAWVYLLVLIVIKLIIPAWNEK
jgi:hypothetical protein